MHRADIRGTARPLVAAPRPAEVTLTGSGSCRLASSCSSTTQQFGGAVAKVHNIVVHIFSLASLRPSVIQDIDVIWWNSKRRVSASLASSCRVSVSMVVFVVVVVVCVLLASCLISWLTLAVGFMSSCRHGGRVMGCMNSHNPSNHNPVWLPYIHANRVPRGGQRQLCVHVGVRVPLRRQCNSMCFFVVVLKPNIVSSRKPHVFLFVVLSRRSKWDQPGPGSGSGSGSGGLGEAETAPHGGPGRSSGRGR